MLINTSSIKKILKQHWLVSVFLVVYVALLSFKIITHKTPFYNWDESIYAQAGREMIRNQFYIAPMWQGQVWHDKPPLPSLIYGLVQVLIPVEPEISTRLVSLFIGMTILVLVYRIYFKIEGNKAISFLAVVLTAFVPSFLQRAQIVNVDIFLLLGWLGYVVFFNNYWISLVFLAVAVLSKSLLGFYPPVIYGVFILLRLFLKQITWEDFKKLIYKILSQVLIVSIWYVMMFFLFGKPFWQMHIVESHLKRVTASIESHFGKRTFYIDLLFKELGIFAYGSILGLFMVFYSFMKQKNYKSLMLRTFFVPWFLFLNLTKTKIEWYIYPVVSQFAYLSVFTLLTVKKYKYIYTLSITLVTVFVLYQNLEGGKLLSTQYSTSDDPYKMAMFVKSNCANLNYLVSPETRDTYKTLQGMNLTITTTSWWGDEPRIVYYSDRPVTIIYDKAQLVDKISRNEGDCFSIEDRDIDGTIDIRNYKMSKRFNDLLLYEHK